MDKQRTRISRLIGIVAVAAVLMAMLMVLSGCNSEPTAVTTGTTEATAAVSDNGYTLYWNLDRAEYEGKSEGGMSSREVESDGLFHIRMFCDGQELILKTSDRKVVNELDTEDLMGLVFDEAGLITDVLPLEQMPLEEVAKKFYVQSVGGKLIKANSSESFVGMEALLECDQAHVYDMSGIAGPVGSERMPTDLTVYDRILAIRNLDGVVTHVFVYDRPNYMLTHEGECIHCKKTVTWFEWVKEDELPVKNGHYQLMVDIQLSGQMSMPTDTKTCLDLNGHTVEGKQDTRMYSIHNAGCEFALMDTSEAQTGRMVGHSTASPQGGIVWVRYGQFHFYSGTLDGSDMISKLNGTVIQVPKNAFFYMHGGTIIGGTAAPQYNKETKAYTYGLGGSVQVSGTMRMYGGTITGGSAPAAYYYKDGKLNLARGMGGNIFLSSGSVMEMQGGLIQYGHAGNVGANIMMDGSAELIISGGKISGGWTDDKITGKNGANVYCPSKAKIVMSGGTIEGGHCNAGSGGNIYLAGTMTMSGGNVFGGVAKVSGGNIHMVSNAKFTMWAGSIRGGIAYGQAAGNGGGNIQVSGDGCVLNIHDGFIYDGTAIGAVNADGTTVGGDGGNINLNKGTLNLDGALVTGGSATGNGGGIYLGWTAKGVTLSGKAWVYGNKDTDICRSGNTDETKGLMNLGKWNGNGDKGSLVIDRLDSKAGIVIMRPVEGVELTAEDAAKFASVHRVLPVVLGEDGNLILAKNAQLGEGDHIHCLCGGKLKDTAGHTCTDVAFVSVNAEEFQLCWTANGDNYDLAGSLNICLTEDITLDTEYRLMGGKLNLCLNGHTITLKDKGRLTANGTTGVLNISDCGDGKIVAAEGCRSAILYTYKGELNVYGGTVDASACASGKGGAVRVGYEGDKFTLYGGKLIGSKKASIGGNIYLEKKGVVTIAGGEVLDGVATDAGGGNIYVSTGRLVISGGKISGGKATGTAATKGLGGNIHAIDGTITITGGIITGGEASGYASDADTKAMSGGIYTGYNQDGITLGGNAKIYGNMGSDIWLTSNAKINLVLDNWAGNGTHGALKLGRLGGNDGTVLATGAQAADLEKFTPAHVGLELKLVSGQIVLKAPLVHTHCICAGKTAGHSCANVNFVEVENTAAFLALFNGSNELINNISVVLTGDVTLNAEYKMVGKTMNLCLNGQTITMEGSGRLTANGTSGVLNITDCGNGMIVAAEGCASSVLYTYKGTLNVYGGTVDASKCASGVGGAVRVAQSVDVFTLYNGTLIGSKNSTNGGTIYCENGAVVNIKGGTVTGGKANKTKATGNGLGGNIHIVKGTLNVTGGTITGGSADGKANENAAANMTGGIYIPYNAVMNLSGNAKIYGNSGSDIYLTSRTDKNVFILGAWEGNGSNGALKIVKLDAVEGTQIIAPASGSLTTADAAKFTSPLEATGLVVNANGGISLEKMHYHCVCGGKLEDHTCTKTAWLEVEDTDAFVALFNSSNELADSVTICLTGDVTLAAEYKLAGKTMTLCLNGHTITMNGGRLTANGGGTLNVTDCGTTGTVKAGTASSSEMLYTYNGNLNLYAGTIDASVVSLTTNAGNGGAVYVNQQSDVFTMYGGVIKAAKKAKYGGCVYVNQGSFVMNDGILYGGEASRGGAVYLQGDGLKGAVTINGGLIQGGTAQYGGCLGANYGTFTMTGGEITGGSATSSGAGINLHYALTTPVVISGTAKIHGNNGADIHCGQKSNQYITIGSDWNGNGGNSMVLSCGGAAGTAIAVAQEGTLAESILSNFAYLNGDFNLAIKDGKVMLAAK